MSGLPAFFGSQQQHSFRALWEEQVGQDFVHVPPQCTVPRSPKSCSDQWLNKLRSMLSVMPLLFLDFGYRFFSRLLPNRPGNPNQFRI